MLKAPIIPRAALQHSGICRHTSGWAARCSFSARPQTPYRGAALSGTMGPARDLVPEIHQKPRQAVIYATGGGMQAIEWLLTAPGASRTVLEARVPYATSAVAEVLGKAPASFASRAAAADLARAAYRQAAQLAESGVPLCGVACASSLVTQRPKKGDHKVHVCVHEGSFTRHYWLKLAKGRRDRRGEDCVASSLLVAALHRACSADGSAQLQTQMLELQPEAGQDEEQLQEAEEDLGDPLQLLLDNQLQTVEFSGGQVVVDAARAGRIYLPGSFNPLHDGHKQMLAAAQKALGVGPGQCCYELTVSNADKGNLPLETVRSRLASFQDSGLPILLTQAPLYTNKARLLPRSTFVVGYDTAIRLVMPRYYGGETGMLLQFAELKHRGCSFLVAGRAEGADFKGLKDLDMPQALSDMELFKEIPESDFRNDVSSTQLRAARE